MPLSFFFVNYLGLQYDRFVTECLYLYKFPGYLLFCYWCWYNSLSSVRAVVTWRDKLCWGWFKVHLIKWYFLLSFQVTITDHGVPPKSTTVRVIVQVLDENDNRPLFLEKIYKIQLPERERPENERAMKRYPVYRVIASDRDDGPNAEISYSIEDGDEHGKFFIEPKTGLVSSKKFSSAGEYDILTVSIYNRRLPLCPQLQSLSVSTALLQQMLVCCFIVVLSSSPQVL